jgi:hypothetical protein
MPNLIKQGEARVVTKNGEVFVNIALELNIKLDGTVIQGATNASGASHALPKEDKVNWAIPDFETNKIDFGK